MKLFLFFLFGIQCTLAANLGKPVPPPVINWGTSSLEICNKEVDEETGVCVQPGTCGEEVKYGHHIGQCGGHDEMGPKFDCCKLSMTCGAMTKATVSYFQNPSYPEAEKTDMACNIKISIRKRVCQLRLDFLTFELPSPNHKTGKCEAKNTMLFMAPARPLGILGGRKNYGLCGLNTGQHVYIPVSYKDTIQVVTTITGRAAVPYNRNNMYDSSSAFRWNIKVTQIECNCQHKYMADLEAPKGCTQYYTENFKRFHSFNFDGHSKFSPDQDYAICIRSLGDSDSGRVCSVDIRTHSFGMPVGGKDIGYCSEGSELINLKKDRECCLDHDSSYLGFVGRQVDPHNAGRSATRRYWCGKELGVTGRAESFPDPIVIKVFSGKFDYPELKELKYDPVGFSLEYKINNGICHD